MAPKYKLTYFDMMGLAEPIRMLLSAANEEFEDVRINRENWPAMKKTTPWEYIPTLEFDGIVLSESITIARFLARKYNMAGEDEIEMAKCDEYVDVCWDIRMACQKYFHPIDDNHKALAKKELEEETFPRVLERFTNILERQGNGHLAGKKLTWADIYVAHMCFIHRKLIFPNLLRNFPLMQKLMDDVFNAPGIKEWISRRPSDPY